jgi:hypothetical protein
VVVDGNLTGAEIRGEPAMNELREKVARAICGAWVATEKASGSIVTPWAKLTEEYKPEFRAQADAVLTVLRPLLEEDVRKAFRDGYAVGDGDTNTTTFQAAWEWYRKTALQTPVTDGEAKASDTQA